MEGARKGSGRGQEGRLGMGLGRRVGRGLGRG